MSCSGLILMSRRELLWLVTDIVIKLKSLLSRTLMHEHKVMSPLSRAGCGFDIGGNDVISFTT